MKLADISISTFVLSDFNENCYLVHLKGETDCFIIDPGDEPGEVIDAIKEQNLNPKAILITHGHCDHIGGIAAIRNVWPEIPILIGELERRKLTTPSANLSALFNRPLVAPEATKTLTDGEEFNLAGIAIKAILIPGHSSGHMVYLLQTEDRKLVFVGDVVFKDGIGRSDFPDGNQYELIDGIQKSLMTLPMNTLLYPGHGEFTDVLDARNFLSRIIY